MPTLSNLQEAHIRGYFTNSSWQEAEKRLVHEVHEATRAGSVLTGRVGKGYAYRPRVEVSGESIIGTCTCSYADSNAGYYCKHIAALLLRWIQAPDSFPVVAGSAGATETDSASPLDVIPVAPPATYRPQNYPAWMLQGQAERRRGEQDMLGKHLYGFRTQDLRELAKRRNWPIKGSNKDQLVRQISEWMGQPDSLRQAVIGLDEEHRSVLRALVVLTVELIAKPDRLRPIAEVWGLLRTHGQIEEYLLYLRELGLALDGESAGSYLGSNSYFTPYPVARGLPPLLADVIPGADQPPSKTMATYADPRPLIRAVGQVALLLEQTPTPLRPPQPRPRLEGAYPWLSEWDYVPAELAPLMQQRGQLTVNTELTLPAPGRVLPDQALTRLAPLAGGEERLDFIMALLSQVGVIQPGSPVTIWPEVKQQFFRRSEPEQRAILARAYFGLELWSELWELLRLNTEWRLRRVFSYYGFSRHDFLEHLLAIRQIVLRTLASLPDERWINRADLFSVLRAAWPRFDASLWIETLHPNSAPLWYLGERRPDGSIRRFAQTDWEQAQGRFVQAMLTGPLHWLGLADYASQDGQVTAFRLNGLANLYWDRVEAPPFPEGTRRIALKPEQIMQVVRDTVTVIPSEISAPAHALLDRIARLDKAGVGRFVYRLDAAAVHQAFEGGATLDSLLSDWQGLLPIAMPQPIRDWLANLWAAYGQVRIYRGVTVIEFGDDYALAEVKAVTTLGDVLIAELSPRLVVIPAEVAPKLVAELERAGYTPKQTDAV